MNKNNLIVPEDLVTVKNFSKKMGVSPAYIYRLEEVGKISFVIVDGVFFVDIKENETFLLKHKRLALRKKIKKIIKETNDEKQN